MMDRRLQFALGLALHILILFAIKPTSGLFEGSLTSVKMMFTNDTTFMNSKGLKIKRVNRTHVLTGSLEFFVDVNNDYQMVTYISKKSGNTYKRTPYKVGPTPFCDYFDNDKYFVEGFRKKSNFPPIGTCPWPKMVYTFDNYELNLNNFPPVIGSGWSDYMMENMYLKDGKVLNGVQGFAKIEHV